MSTVVSHEMLMKRALAFLAGRLEEKPGCRLSDVLDEAGVRFNLSPADGAALESLFHASASGKNAGISEHGQ